MPLLHWLTRDADIHTATHAPYRLLEEAPDLSHGDRDTGNMLIQGDNLDALKALLPYYAGKVKCIFIDPPYNTRSAFEHYDDNLEHAQWLAMLYPRLELLRSLLSEDGSIWVTIDDNEAHYLKVIMDEVFGRKNFISSVVWQKRVSPANDAKYFSSDHDYVVVYAKRREGWTPNRLPRTEQQNSYYKNPDNDPRGSWNSVTYTGNKTRAERPNLYYGIKNPFTGEIVWPPETLTWRYGQETHLQNEAQNLLYWGKSGTAKVPRFKMFLDNAEPTVPRSVWSSSDCGSTQTSMTEQKTLFKEAFGTPKPELLLQRILLIATHHGDLVLDSFLGSGTTAAVAHKMSRRYIGIEMGDHAVTHCAPRLRKVIEGEQGGISEAVSWTSGGGFRFYRLGVPVFDETGHIAPGIRFAPLAAHLWFVETGFPYSGDAASPLLGVHEETAYYLLYNGILGDKRPNGGNILTARILSGLPPHDGPKVIFGEGCRMSAERLTREGITFRQIPYEIKARQETRTMELKDFQRTALDTLTDYLESARLSGDPEQAFIQVMRQLEPDKNPPPYRTIPKLPGVPNVCLRLPTGGGKTLLAAHTVSVAGRSYLERDYPVVLWLVPTNTIRTQTAEALKKPSHPYRAAIDEAFAGRVSVFDIGEIDQIRPQDLTERVSIIVCTIQTLRVSNTEGRKAYAHSENYEPHFAHIPDTTAGLERGEDGKIKFSFVNLMAFHRPLVIVDEAHKAGTNLSFDMLAALRPSCIVEFTATPNTDPRNGSNVLFRASAAQVKNADMIKLPIILTEHPDWRAAVHDAIETRARLADTAKSDPRYIRPLTLFQAQDKGQEVTVEVLKKYLIDNEHIAPEKIAIATGAQRELDALNLFDPACKVEFIITVEALKEGWDCSFAYVLCSVANIGSATDIEQLLGRVLRMPYAQARPNAALNRAYAHVSSPRFGDGARALTDTLVQKMGFEPDEAAGLVEQRQATLPGFGANADLFNRAPVLLETVDSAPDLTGLAPEVIERVQVETRADGTVTVTVQGEIPDELEQRLIATVSPDRHEAMRAAVQRHRITHRNSMAPAERGEKFAVPRLFLHVQGELELAEEALILELGGWTLNRYAAELAPAEFSIRETAERWEVDLRGEKVVYQHLDQNAQLEIGALKLDWTDLELSRWLDRETLQMDVKPNDITQPVRLEFCRKLVAYLIEQRGIPLHELLRFKYQLAKVTHQKIAGYRKQAYASGYQTFLLAPEAPIETSFADGFAFDNRPYPAAWFYRGRLQFKKHFFGGVGELHSEGEEFECAQLIDTLPQVKYWIRNLSGPGRQQTSFWLPTSTDRFYPDFVALLHDGRIFVIEYKGAYIATTDDTKEKRNIGALWAAKSCGNGRFLMAEKKNEQGQTLAQQLAQAIA